MMMNLRLAVAEWPTRKAGEPATKPVLAFVDAYGEVMTPCGDLDPRRVQIVRDWLDEAQRCIEGQQEQEAVTGGLFSPAVRDAIASGGIQEWVTVGGESPVSQAE